METIYIFAEDRPALAVLYRILQTIDSSKFQFQHFDLRGNSKLRKNINKYIELSKRNKVIILTDLDKKECPLILINQILNKKSTNDNLLFMVSIQEIEAWILADNINAGEFFKIDHHSVTIPTDSIENPKEYFMNLIKRQSPKEMQLNIIANDYYYTAKRSPNYNNTLEDFIKNFWNLDCAKSGSLSLKRCINKLNGFLLR